MLTENKLSGLNHKLVLSIYVQFSLLYLFKEKKKL